MNGGKETLWAQVVTEDTKNQGEKGKKKEVEGKVKKIKRHNEEQKKCAWGREAESFTSGEVWRKEMYAWSGEDLGLRLIFQVLPAQSWASSFEP